MPKTPEGIRQSALNRLRYGCELDFLPCKRSDCVFAETCRRHPLTRRHGFPPAGEDCPLERVEHEAFVESALDLFDFAREWLDEPEYRGIIERLSILRIRWVRISARIHTEGGIVRTEFPGGQVILREHIAFDRYWPKTQREWTRLLDRLLEPPSDWEGTTSAAVS